MSPDHIEGTRLVIADDSLLVREGITRALSSRGFTIIATAGDGDELIRKVAGHKPDAAIADIRMPPSGTDEGLRAADRIAIAHPGVAVLVLSEYLEPEFAARLLQNGTPGRGYLLKDSVTDLDRFAESVRRVIAGESVVDPRIIRQVLGTAHGKHALLDLSDREREILTLMAEGRTNLAIAREYVISERTVEKHIGNVFSKLGLPTSADDHRRVLAVLAYLRT